LNIPYVDALDRYLGFPSSIHNRSKRQAYIQEMECYQPLILLDYIRQMARKMKGKTTTIQTQITVL
jgi:hypothetical protein